MTIQINELVIRAEIAKQAGEKNERQTNEDSNKVIQSFRKDVRNDNKNKRER
ncbi:hypothetical protein AGMMS50239_38300 [Bacteroidia bacterium]|nr:hypothetical protein AGMMS50239_38300 [Bacteroidia bacterium]GHV31687.1 hypothetical protein FACS1894177_06740 [Bacteroidia bacterium]